jgi:hydroxymethylpyrimidine/phosphomethylpyrimidine kinase
MKSYKKVLSIAGSDSGGGAGIQADIKAISACGAYAMTAQTAITVQNTLGVSGIHSIPLNIIRDQIRVVLDDLGADAVKIGMLADAETVYTVAETLKQYDIKKIVLDPVMVATSGDRLATEETADALKLHLIPISMIVTPNIPEAEILSGIEIKDDSVYFSAAAKILKLGVNSVLIKGGHLDSNSLVDSLFIKNQIEPIQIRNQKIKTNNTHGTGCTLSSAIAAFLARDYDLPQAVKLGVEYVYNSIKFGAEYTTGKGNGPVAHFYKFWE